LRKSQWLSLGQHDCKLHFKNLKTNTALTGSHGKRNNLFESESQETISAKEAKPLEKW
jgi:hypothetical protein